MGADGGICYVKYKDYAAFHKYCFFWDMISNSSEMDREENRGEDVYYPRGCIVGYYKHGYGYDLDLGSLIDLVKFILDKPTHYRFKPEWIHNGVDVRDYTFKYIVSDLKKINNKKNYIKHSAYILAKDPGYPTHPILSKYLDMGVLLDVILFKLFEEKKLIIPEYLNDITVREWALKISESIDIDSYNFTETWT